MKLDHKRTVLVGLAFLSICAFWQMYDNLIPKILTETFHMGESVSGSGSCICWITVAIIFSIACELRKLRFIFSVVL